MNKLQKEMIECKIEDLTDDLYERYDSEVDEDLEKSEYDKKIKECWYKELVSFEKLLIKRYGYSQKQAKNTKKRMILIGEAYFKAVNYE